MILLLSMRLLRCPAEGLPDPLHLELNGGFMSKLLAALTATVFSVGLSVAVAQNVNADKDSAQSKDNPSTEQSSSNAQQGKDCARLSGKEKDECIQATPAGPVDMETGEGSKAKSETAKERDRAKSQSEPGESIPAQSNDTVGHPEERTTTGEGQTLEESEGAGSKK